MPRRTPYTKVEKTNQLRANRVKGMGDVVFRGFECLNSECANFITIRDDEINVEDFEIACPKCGYAHIAGGQTKFYDYKLVDKRRHQVLQQGDFAILHNDYIEEAHLYKLCIICNTLKPVDYFDRHATRKSGRQGECRLCKAVYNAIKNQTRLPDQHREAAQKRRLYSILSLQSKIDSEKISKRFRYRCFKCSKDLSGAISATERPLDHTLPASFLWPLTTENATLLCREHNAEKTGKWPSEFYNERELRRLSVTTGIRLELLKSRPHFNPEALQRLHDSAFVDGLLEKYSAYIDELIHLRNRILKASGFDYFNVSKQISPAWIKLGNQRLK